MMASIRMTFEEEYDYGYSTLEFSPHAMLNSQHRLMEISTFHLMSVMEISDRDAIGSTFLDCDLGMLHCFYCSIYV